MTMIRKTISIPGAMDEWVKRQIADGRYGNDSEYFRDLIRRDQDRHNAESQLRELLQAGEASGVSPRTVLDIMAAAKIITALADIACRHRHELESLEINPLLVLGDQAIALDARAILNRDNPESRQVA